MIPIRPRVMVSDFFPAAPRHSVTALISPILIDRGQAAEGPALTHLTTDGQTINKYLLPLE
eukprot:2639830-Pyramimonas_sp.AAC.1